MSPLRKIALKGYHENFSVSSQVAKDLVKTFDNETLAIYKNILTLNKIHTDLLKRRDSMYINVKFHSVMLIL